MSSYEVSVEFINWLLKECPVVYWFVKILSSDINWLSTSFTKSSLCNSLWNFVRLFTKVFQNKVRKSGWEGLKHESIEEVAFIIRLK
jgi:hypothetical protein